MTTEKILPLDIDLLKRIGPDKTAKRRPHIPTLSARRSNSALTDQQVGEVRFLRDHGWLVKDLLARYGSSVSTIKNICAGYTRPQVEPRRPMDLHDLTPPTRKTKAQVTVDAYITTGKRAKAPAPLPEPPMEFVIGSDPGKTLAEWRTWVRELIHTYGKDAFMRTDAGPNSVSIVVTKRSKKK